MLNYSYSEFAMIYSLYFSHYLFGGRLVKRTQYFVYKFKDILEKINNFFKIPKNKPIVRILYS